MRECCTTSDRHLIVPTIPIIAICAFPKRRPSFCGQTTIALPFFERRPIMPPLRRRMIQELNLRNFAANTQEAYIRAVAKFAEHYGRSPESLGKEEVRDYLL